MIQEAVTGEAEFQLMLEPGRSLVASACILLTSVLGTKEGQEGRDRNYAVVDAAMTELLRPALYTAEHLVIPVKEREKGEEKMEYDIVGPVCESTDKLASNIKLCELSKGFVTCCYIYLIYGQKPRNLISGELLAIMDAGAYVSSMASNYNMRPRVWEVMVSGDQAEIIAKRESFENLLERFNV